MHNLSFGSENLQFCDGVPITIFRLRLFLLLCLNHLMIFHFCSKVKNCFFEKRCTIFFRAYFFSIESMMQNKPSGLRYGHARTAALYVSNVSKHIVGGGQLVDRQHDHKTVLLPGLGLSELPVPPRWASKCGRRPRQS